MIALLEGLLKTVLRHRWTVLLVVACLAARGAWDWSHLPIDAVPDITNNQVQVNTLLSALSPEEMERQVTQPMEASLAGIPGLESTRSLTRNGFSQVTAIFSASTDIYFARQQVGERLRELTPSLPAGADPQMGPISTGLGEVVMWVLDYAHPEREFRTPEGRLVSTREQRGAYLRELQDWFLRPQLRQVAGVAGVEAIGGYRRQWVIHLEPLKMAARGISLDQLKKALEANNLSSAAGFIERRGESLWVRADSRLRQTSDVEQLVVGLRNGVPVRIGDFASVSEGGESRSGSASSMGREVVVGTALMRIGQNSREVAQAVVARIEELKPSLPSGIELKVVLQRSYLVDETLRTVQRNLLEGALLVIAVLFVLLGNLRAAVLTSMAIPLAMLLTAGGMRAAHVSGNLMSLGAIDFGLIVDSAVIIVENCLRRLAERQHELGRALTSSERLEVLEAASHEVRSASLLGEAIILMVYLPVLFLQGVPGKMFQPMAVTVMLALLAAFALSLTYIPAALAVFLPRRVEERENFLMRWAQKAYAPCLEWALRWRAALLLGALLLTLASTVLAGRLGRVLVPQLGEGNLAMHAMRLPNCGIEQSTEMQLKLENVLKQRPEVAVIFSKTGTADLASDPMPPSTSDAFIMLRPRSQWPHPEMTQDQLAAELQELAESVPGQNYEMTQPIQMRFEELLAGVRGAVAVKVYGENLDVLKTAAEQIARALRQVRGAQDVKVEQIAEEPFLVARIKREEAGRLGIAAGEVHEQLTAAIRGLEAGEVVLGERRVPLVVRLPDDVRRDRVALAQLPIQIPQWTSQGHQGENPAFVPLRSVATLQEEPDHNQISRENGQRRLAVTANVRGRDVGSFVEEAQQKVAQLKLPQGVAAVRWGGEFETLKQATYRLKQVVPVCLLAILVLLYWSFHSWRLALLVFFSLPLALPGGVLALHLRSLPFSLSAAVGFIALSGVAILNALVLVSVIVQLRERGRSARQAVIEGAQSRLRPVLMTALVASLGFLPMALGHGTGAEVQRPLATVVIGGLITSTLLTLLIIPALYNWFFSGAATQRPLHQEAPSVEVETG